MGDDCVFVALGKQVKANILTLIWALITFKPQKICILHVFSTAQTSNGDPLKERDEANKALNEYIQICAKEGVTAEKIIIEEDSIQDGIVKLISNNNITRLVMGAAPDNRYTTTMMQLESSKAKHVQIHAPEFCDIWFVCNGSLVFRSEQGVGVGRICNESVRLIENYFSFDYEGLKDWVVIEHDT